ncbi:MAG: NAD(P)/FAD-dependent oxidoreductase [Calditrichaeota bacterium]|nr:NAD(P)/FAD-dependent oxidoreductase [Calditrichota bacterium]
MKNQNLFDVLIIGAGPAGLTASIFAHDKNFNVALVEGLEAGGQLKNLYPHKPVYNYPGYANIKAGKLANYMLHQVKEKGITVWEQEPVSQLVSLKNGRFLAKSTNLELESKAIILTCGMGLLEPRKLEVPGETELQDKMIFYTLKNLEQWANQKVLIVGGGNSALDNALLLLESQCHVTVIHKSDKFQAEPATVEELEKKKIELLRGWHVTQVEKSSDGKLKISAQSTDGTHQKDFISDKMLINIGLKPRIDFLKSLNLDLKGRQVLVNSEMQTTTPGVFACGDVVSYPGKVRLIVTAIGEAATSVNSLGIYLKSLSN